MRVLFADVGQGTCQIILLGGRRAIVIDTGASPELPLKILQLAKIDRLELLVISHSHTDHSGGAAKLNHLMRSGHSGILADYHHSIGRIACVFDAQMKHRPFGRYLAKLLQAKDLRKEQLLNIEASEKPKLLWQSDDAGTRLTAISPLGGDHLLADVTNNPNASSAVLELRHRGDRVVFSADSEFSQWRDIYRLRQNNPLTCKVMTMPHHGGKMHGTAEDIQWLCNEAVRAEVMIVSVATANQHGHPREEVIRTAASSGSHIMCTQITEKCCSRLETLRPGVIGPQIFPCASSSSPDFTRKAQRSRNVACAGTVSALLNADGIKIERQNQHRAGVDKLVAGGSKVLCRNN